MSRPATKADLISSATENYEEMNRLIDSLSEKELSTPFEFDEKKERSTLGSYFVSNTASHYNWAIKKLKAHRKNCKNL